MQPWHLTIASVGRNTLFVDPTSLTRGDRTLARVAGHHLLLFAIVDDHLHLVLHCDRLQAAHTASAVSRALRKCGAPPLAPVFVREVEGRRHLENLVGYCIRQPAKHGIPGHPATYIGSCAPDLLGLRVLPGFDPRRIAAVLPRCDVRAFAASAAGPAPRTPASWSTAEAVGALLPGETSRHATRVRIAWASLASRPTAPVSRRTWYRYRTHAADPDVLSALKQRIG